jgi:hypothetical protein
MTAVHLKMIGEPFYEILCILNIIEILEVSDVISGVISSHCHFPLQNQLVTN